MKDSKTICYSRGVLGTLTEEQNEQCKKKEMKSTPKTVQRHYEKFGELGAITKICFTNDEGQTTEEFYKCVDREARNQI